MKKQIFMTQRLVLPALALLFSSSLAFADLSDAGSPSLSSDLGGITASVGQAGQSGQAGQAGEAGIGQPQGIPSGETHMSTHTGQSSSEGSGGRGATGGMTAPGGGSHAGAGPSAGGGAMGGAGPSSGAGPAGGAAGGSSTGTGPAAGAPSSGAGSTAESGGGEIGNIEAATEPQYWITDASIFISNAISTANGMSKESNLTVQDPNVIGNQAMYLFGLVDRARNDLSSLLQNANATHPEVVSQIQDTIARLDAAQTQVNAFVQVASQGYLGPAYSVTANSALEHLRAAQQGISQIAKTYGAEQLLVTPEASGGAPAAGAGAGANQPAGGAGAGASQPAGGAGAGAGSHQPAGGAGTGAAQPPGGGAGAGTSGGTHAGGA